MGFKTDRHSTAVFTVSNPTSARLRLAGIGICTACVLLFAAGASADELRVHNRDNVVLAAADVPTGARANVIVACSAPQNGGNSLITIELASGGWSQTALLDGRGHAEFHAVEAGSYVLTAGDPSLAFADVRIQGAAARQVNSAQQERVQNRAAYVAGASALAGAAGIALAGAGSIASSGRSDALDGRAGPMNGQEAAAQLEPVGQVQPSGIYDDVAPNAGTISPPPATGTVNPTPPAPGPFGPDEPVINDPDILETPRGPTTIVPAPPPTDPMSPS